MKFQPNDKVILFYAKSAFGVDYGCLTGTLIGVRRETFTQTRVVKIRAHRSFTLAGSTKMKNLEMEVSTAVWTMLPWNEENWLAVEKLKATCLSLALQLKDLKGQTSVKKDRYL